MRTYDDMLALIDRKENFSFLRYGDGEWVLALTIEPRYSQIGLKYGNSILLTSSILKQIILSSPEYFIGLQPLAIKLWSEMIIKVIPPSVKTLNGDILHNASLSGSLQSFFSVLKNREVVIVGPSYLKDLNYFKFDHVISNQKTSWLFCDQMEEQIETIIKIKLIRLSYTQLQWVQKFL